jgi:hypothetical protein
MNASGLMFAGFDTREEARIWCCLFLEAETPELCCDMNSSTNVKFSKKGGEELRITPMPENEFGVGAFACKICYNRWKKIKQKEQKLKKRRTSIAPVRGDGGDVDADHDADAEVEGEEALQVVDEARLMNVENEAMEATVLAVSPTAAGSVASSTASEDVPAKAATSVAEPARTMEEPKPPTYPLPVASSTASEDVPAKAATSVAEPARTMEEPKPPTYPLPLQPNRFWTWDEERLARWRQGCGDHQRPDQGALHQRRKMEGRDPRYPDHARNGRPRERHAREVDCGAARGTCSPRNNRQVPERCCATGPGALARDAGHISQLGGNFWHSLLLALRGRWNAAPGCSPRMAVPHGSAPVRTVKRFHEEVGHLLVYRDGREERVNLRARLRRTLSGSSFLSPSGKQEQLSDVCRLWRDWRSTANAKGKSIE